MTGHEIRKPFKWRGALHICTGISGAGLTDSGMREYSDNTELSRRESFTGNGNNLSRKDSKGRNCRGSSE